LTLYYDDNNYYNNIGTACHIIIVLWFYRVEFISMRRSTYYHLKTPLYEIYLYYNTYVVFAIANRYKNDRFRGSSSVKSGGDHREPSRRTFGIDCSRGLIATDATPPKVTPFRESWIFMSSLSLWHACETVGGSPPPQRRDTRALFAPFNDTGHFKGWQPHKFTRVWRSSPAARRHLYSGHYDGTFGS